MFTQCDKCETVFRLTADALRAAGGQVRCGRCGEVFNALTRIAEDAGDFTQGESSLTLESRADEILHSADPTVSVVPEEAGEYDVARLQVLEPSHPEGSSTVDARGSGDSRVQDTSGSHTQGASDSNVEGSGDSSLEFTLPAGELDRVFVETTPNLLKVLAEAHRFDRQTSPMPGATAESTSSEPASPPATALLPGVSPATAAPVLPAAAEPTLVPELPTAELSPAAPRLPSAADAPAALQLPAAPESLAVPSLPIAPHNPGSARLPVARISGLEVSESVRREMMASFSHAELPVINRPRRRLPAWGWACTSVLLGALLAAQLIAANADWLMTHTPLLGNATTGPSLSAYQLRQWGVTGDPGAQGSLRVRATILNTAAQLEPYPLLRVTLANRFGTRIAERAFEPSEYLAKAVAHLLAPGERVDATLDIVDPGKEAEGFEIDVCVRGYDKKITCAGDTPTAAAPQARQ